MSVVIFEGFLLFNFDVVWEVFGGPLGPSWRSLGTLFGGFLGPLGASWGRFGELLGALWEVLGSSWALCRPRSPKKYPKESPRAPQDGSKRP